ncbi:Bifunctional protein MdtA [Thalassoglobus neptunius]|uniref:Bifunctional protein MdtA n=1 Tax=Thalassoglobus neptunius TaxID=1938619 RepID=A0A5C5WP25_9PLAN|nr:NADP-dependent methylenetetrahydromethanopterin/methylenetetrahydrofolate dehydrogenase [Thalassoglobus neptunius]TWT51889.1 Bifunctional protein MdtA [Thalassoglobus neptunius]
MKKILIQLDTDALPSSFDRVVAIDAGVDEILSYGNVTPENVVSLVHGAIFTRKPDDLSQTALFIGGSHVESCQRLHQKILETFLGPMRVSLMMDPNGSNTTAAAAVRCAARHLDLKQSEVLILGGTGPVGRGCAEILATLGANVRVASRSLERAQSVCAEVRHSAPESKLSPAEFSDEGIAAAVDGVNLIIAAGAAGVRFLTAEELEGIDTLKVAIDVNAVPPTGLEGIDPSAEATDLNGVTCYGALTVGALKMKTHRSAIQTLFTSNDQDLDSKGIYALSGDVS